MQSPRPPHPAHQYQYHYLYQYHIVWDGFGEAGQPPCQAEACRICEKDLSSPGSQADDEEEEEEEDDEYEYYFEQLNLAVVGVLACGHIYHAGCLENITPEDWLTEPPCMVCLSMSFNN